MSTVMMPGIQELTEQAVENVNKPEETWSLICMNDDIHPFEAVILALLRVKLDIDTAKQKTFAIHTEGSAVVKSGLTKDDALIDRHIIVDTTKCGGMFPGIQVEIVEDS